MSALVTCPHPARCGAASHRHGSKAARACASRTAILHPQTTSAPPAPGTRRARSVSVAEVISGVLTGAPTPSITTARRTRERLEADLVALLDATDAEAGWDFGNTTGPHPTGGYHHREITRVPDGVLLAFYDDTDQPHRTGGPAKIEYDSYGAITDAEHWDQGFPHRGDGPAEVHHRPGLRGELRFYHREANSRMMEVRLNGHDGKDQTTERYLGLLDEGLAPREATSWLVASTYLQRGEVNLLREDGADADLTIAALSAGIRDFEQLTAVACGHLPLSWASAGL